MGSGREGSPSNIQVAEAQQSARAASRKMSPSMNHRLEREELLSISPLPLPELAPAGPPSSQRSPARMKTPHDDETRGHSFVASEVAPPDLRFRGRRRNPKVAAMAMAEGEESLGKTSKGSSRKVKAETVEIEADGEESLGKTSNGSLRNPRVAEMAMADAEESLAKTSKGSSRKVKAETVEIQEGLPGTSVANEKKNKRSLARQYTRQHKRKVSDSLPALPLALPHESSALPLPSEPRRSFSSRRAAREARTHSESSDWLHYAVDVIMWTHVPRSWLLFGVGCFCILSTSVIQDMNYSIVSTISYSALTCLVAVFLRQSVAYKTSSMGQPSSYFELSEAHVVKVVRILLPVVNATLKKLSQLFSGDPTTTLKVAIALWLLAQSGYIMSFWTFIRLAYLAMFIIPKFYASYHNELHEYTRNLIECGLGAWNSCSYKKAILFTVFAVGWSLFSTLSRIFGAFILIVALRAYKQNLGSEQPNSNVIPHESNGARAMQE